MLSVNKKKVTSNHYNNQKVMAAYKTCSLRS